MIHFLSNHKDISFLQECFSSDKVEVIPHPCLSPDWSAEDIEVKCKDIIEKSSNAETLIMNGDYTLVGLILLKRSHAGKWTGFLSMKKESSPNVIKNPDGKITYINTVRPVGIRWIR
jgi:hypothetical protein